MRASLLPPPPIVNGVLRVDGSTLKEYLLCPVRASFKHWCRRVANEGAPALVAGGAWAAGLACLRSHTATDPEMALSDAKNILREEFDKRMTESPCEPDHRNAERLCGALEEYAAQYADDRRKMEYVAVETKFDLPLGTVTWVNVDDNGEPIGKMSEARREVQVRWTGRRDLDVHILADDSYGVLDDKMTTKDAYALKYQEAFQLDFSMRGYVWAARVQTGKPYSFVVPSVAIIRPELQRETARSKPRNEFVRGARIYYSDENLEAWRTNVLCHVEAWLRAYHAGWLPENPGACTAFGRTCDYLSICAGPEAERVGALQMDCYRDYTWSPLE